MRKGWTLAIRRESREAVVILGIVMHRDGNKINGLIWNTDRN